MASLSRGNSFHSADRSTAHSHMSMSDAEDDMECNMPADFAERLVKKTEGRVEQVLGQSKFIQSHCKIKDAPTFDREDLDIGERIARGGFSNVHEILGFRVETELTKGDNEERQYIIKHLNPKLAFNPKKLVVGAKDLVMEAHFLSSFDHRNIIQLKAWSKAGIAGFSETGRADGFFLIFDRLSATLSERIADWREMSKESREKEGKVRSMMKGRSNVRMQLFTERTQVAVDVADAVEYLHSKRILYRDLKPANIGFDQNDVVKIFDFGLAVELPEGSDPDSTFNLAGNTGTSRYMAVEVIRKQPYNVKADVFSFSILLWEIIALVKPYDGVVGQEVKELVSVFGERPAIPQSWPTSLRRIMRRGWAEDLMERPHMADVKDVLVKIVELSASKTASK